MFTFKIFEIPEGKSEKKLNLSSADLDLDDISFKGGEIDLEFDRSSHFILVKLAIDVLVELTCDRSLDNFDFEVKEDYQVLFKHEQVEESIDENGAVRNIDHISKQISIKQDVLDTVLVSLPAKKLHPRFLDENGEPKELLNEKFGDAPSNEEDGESIDPRWEALKELKN